MSPAVFLIRRFVAWCGASGCLIAGAISLFTLDDALNVLFISPIEVRAVNDEVLSPGPGTDRRVKFADERMPGVAIWVDFPATRDTAIKRGEVARVHILSGSSRSDMYRYTSPEGDWSKVWRFSKFMIVTGLLGVLSYWLFTRTSIESVRPDRQLLTRLMAIAFLLVVFLLTLMLLSTHARVGDWLALIGANALSAWFLIVHVVRFVQVSFSAEMLGRLVASGIRRLSKFGVARI